MNKNFIKSIAIIIASGIGAYVFDLITGMKLYKELILFGIFLSLILLFLQKKK